MNCSILNLNELSLCFKIWFSDPKVLATQCHKFWILQAKNSVRSNNLSLKYQRFSTSVCKDIGFIKKFVTKSQFILSVLAQIFIHDNYYFYF